MDPVCDPVQRFVKHVEEHLPMMTAALHQGEATLQGR
tara:strand:- start:325 stop:435 length:111 start_codon:yes stop_codon:yes gene_type:complete